MTTVVALNQDAQMTHTIAGGRDQFVSYVRAIEDLFESQGQCPSRMEDMIDDQLAKSL